MGRQRQSVAAGSTGVDEYSYHPFDYLHMTNILITRIKQLKTTDYC